MDSADIRVIRLKNQLLNASSFETPEEVVKYFGAIQAQDYEAAKWSLHQRLHRVEAERIEQAFNEGKFLRSHVMRPTWHFVVPEDIRWMLSLTAPSIRKKLAPYDTRLGISQSVLDKCSRVIEKVLEGGNCLTRTEIADILYRHDIPARGQRLGHIMVHLEIGGLVCSGPKRGRQMTYALLEERAPPAVSLTREQAQARLAFMYFRSHGPAQLRDFAWWSGLSSRDASTGLESIKSDLQRGKVSGKEYFYVNPVTDEKPPKPVSVLFLSIFDEFTIAYRDRSDISPAGQLETMLSMGNSITGVTLVDGLVAGTWKTVKGKQSTVLSLNLFRELNEDEKDGLRKQIETLARFGRTVIDLRINVSPLKEVAAVETGKK